MRLGQPGDFTEFFRDLVGQGTLLGDDVVVVVMGDDCAGWVTAVRCD